MQATRIIAIRHGETAWNVDTRIQGHLDIPLNDTGHWQARQLGRALAHEPVTAIYSSDLQRAMATAQAVADTTGAPLLPERDLRERHFGTLEGHTFREVEAEQQARAGELLEHRAVGAGQPVYIVAEIGINHNGDVETAKRLVDAASVAGLLLTTEVMIAEAPKEEAEHSHGPPGGMGGMGDMGM